MNRRGFLVAGLAGVAGTAMLTRPFTTFAHAPKPVLIGLDAEFGLINSTSAQAIEKGIRVAIEEINQSGGVLDGRPLALVTTDNRSVPARATQNVQQLAATPELVAVFGGRFSPAVIECLPVVQEHTVPMLLPWSAANNIIDNGFIPNYAFRLSLRDGFVMPVMLRFAAAHGWSEVGLLVPNTAWGRSSFDTVQRYGESNAQPHLVATEWFNWGDQQIVEKYRALRIAGAKAIIFIANDAEAVSLVNDVGQLPAEQRLPIVSHWGVTGGKFPELVGDNLGRVNYTVVQSFSFFSGNPAKVARVLSGLQKLFGVSRIEEIESPVGVAHAYDLTHILARAIRLAGSTDRAAIRGALERVEHYDGLIKTYDRPFTPTRHEALSAEDAFMARYADDGTIRPIGSAG